MLNALVLCASIGSNPIFDNRSSPLRGLPPGLPPVMSNPQNTSNCTNGTITSPIDLGNIPIIGEVLVGGEGEGIFAATYTVRGPLDEPVMTVNPLAALAPGFLRNLFSVFDRDAVTQEETVPPSGSDSSR